MAIVALVWSSQARAATWIVKADGTGDAPTIQSAVSQAASGDIIQVGPGTYYEDIFITGKDLILESQQGYASTILDGSMEDSSVVVVVDDSFHSVTIRGFTITGGKGTSPPGSTSRGGGIFGFGYLRLIVEQCHITGNMAEFGGAGRIRNDPDAAFFDLPEVSLQDNIIENNSATGSGGGFYCAQTHAEIQGNVFHNNSARFDAGGLNIGGNAGSATVTNNIFSDNEALDKGGAIQISFTGWASPPTVESNLFVNNKASGQDGNDIGTGGAILVFTTVGASIHRNTIAFNDGTGDTGCSGGAIALLASGSPIDIRENIIANNLGCGIACYQIPDPSAIVMGPNLFWQNSGADIGQVLDECPADWAASIVTGDPFFCDPNGNDYTCREDSPALVGPIFFGAFLTAGCPTPTPALHVTWGDIKSRFYESPPTSNRKRN